MFFAKNNCDFETSTTLDVRFTKKCDNNCQFCIEKEGIDNLTQDVDIMINTTLSSNLKSVLILGGEPFINVDKLHKYVMAITCNVPEIFITSSLPKALNINNPKVIDILNVITGLNVSFQHYDWVKNNDILHSTSNHNRLEQLNTFTQDYGSKIRVNLNLTKNNLDTMEELEKALEVFSNVGVNEIKINELNHVTKQEFVSYEAITHYDMPSPFAFGCRTNVTNHWKHNCNINAVVLLQRACFDTQPSMIKKASFFDFIKFCIKIYILKERKKTNILYENGELSQGWIKK